MNCLGDDGLYFVGGIYTKMGMFISQFEKVDIQTHEIEFIQKLDVPEGVKADSPICKGRRLYMRDSLNTPYMFTRKRNKVSKD